MRGNFFPLSLKLCMTPKCSSGPTRRRTHSVCRIKRKKCKLCFISSHFSCSFNLYVKETQAVCSHSAGSRLGCNDNDDAENRRLDWAELSAALRPARELYFALLYSFFPQFLPSVRATDIRSVRPHLLLSLQISLLSERMIELYSVVLMDFSFHSLTATNNWLMVIIMNRLGFECKHQQPPDFNSNIDFFLILQLNRAQ